MVYEYVVHPRTGEKYPINSEKATKILITYIQQINALKSKKEKDTN